MIRFFAIAFVSIAIIIGNITIYATPPVIGKPWHQNTREHLFGFVDNTDRVAPNNCSIEDEGFRWRNSFNFTVNGHNIIPINWWFNRVVHFTPAPVNDFSDTEVGGARIGYMNNMSSDDIHNHLTEIAWNIKTINGATVAVAAAITIVIEHRGQFHAFSKVLSSGRRAFVSLNPNAVGRHRNLSYISINANEVRANLLNRYPRVEPVVL